MKLRVKLYHPSTSLPIFFILSLILCSASFHNKNPKESIKHSNFLRFDRINQPNEKIHILSGLDNLLQNYPHKLKGKKVGIVTNQTGVSRDGTPNWEIIDGIDGVQVAALFSPEHGLFGEAAAGQKLNYGQKKQNLPQQYSLYGKTRKPTPEMLADLDLIIYDIQDIGARFYTYITTLGLVLEAAGEAGIPVMVLDRPNPLNGLGIVGPVLDLKYQSNVGYYPIPVEYGLTPGELARMMIGEEWIDSKPSLEVIPLREWKRGYWYDEFDLPWVKPSPNIPDLNTAIVYPGTVFLEATNVSEGRGTDHPFLWIGAPWIDNEYFAQEMNKNALPGIAFDPVEFTPSHLPGVAQNPKYEDENCYGVELIVIDRSIFQSVKTGISILLFLYSNYPDKFTINVEWLNRLTGTDLVFRAIQEGWSLERIIESFSQNIKLFNAQRQKYLLY